MAGHSRSKNGVASARLCPAIHERTVPTAFTASETFDVGVDLGSPVSREYFDRRPFKFNGAITSVYVQMK